MLVESMCWWLCYIFLPGDWKGIGGNLGAVCSVVIVTVRAKSADANLAIRRVEVEGNQGVNNNCQATLKGLLLSTPAKFCRTY